MAGPDEARSQEILRIDHPLTSGLHVAARNEGPVGLELEMARNGVTDALNAAVAEALLNSDRTLPTY